MQNESVKLTPEYIIEIILKRRWYIIVPFCLCMLIGMVYSLRAPKVYEASTLILVEPPSVPENYVQPIVTDDPTTRINTISEQINSRTNLERIINEFNLFSGAKYEKMFLEDKVESIRKRISVEVRNSRRGSDTFSVSYRGSDPEKTMQVANSLASFFIDENLKNRESLARNTSEFITDELNTMRRRLLEVEGNLEAHRKKYMGELPEQLHSNLAILERLQQQMTDRRQSLREERNRLAVVDQLIASPPTLTQGGDGQQPRAVGETSDLDLLKEQLAILTTKYTERHPDVVKVKNMIADLERRREKASIAASQATSSPALRPQSPSLRDENFRQREEIRLAISSLETEIGELQGQINYYQGRVEATPKREQELAALQRDYNNIQTAYSSLLGRKLEADIAVNMETKQKGEQFQVIDRATLPQRPVAPDMRKLFIIFLAAGLGIGAGIVLLMEYLDKSFRRLEDVEPLGVNILGIIPVIANRKMLIWRRTNQILSICSVLVSIALFVGFFAVTF